MTLETKAKLFNFGKTAAGVLAFAVGAGIYGYGLKTGNPELLATGESVMATGASVSAVGLLDKARKIFLAVGSDPKR